MAQLVATTTEFDIGTYGLGGSQGEAVALGNGTYLVTWRNTVSGAFPIDGISDTDSTAVFGRIVNDAGVPQGEAFQVNTSEGGLQSDPQVIVLKGGGFVIAWTDLDFATGTQSEARAQVYTESGVKVGGEITLATSDLQDQRIPQLAATDDGGFLAMWQDARSTSSFDDDLYGQYFTANGTRAGAEFVAINNSTNISRFDLVVLDDGGIRIIADNQLFTSNGDLITTGSIPVLNATSSSLNNTQFAQNFATELVKMPDGLYAYAGVTALNGGFGIGLKVKDSGNFDNFVLNSSFGSLFMVSDDSFPIAAQNFVGVDMAALSDGGLVVVWAFFTPGLNGGSGDFNVMAQAFDASLVKQGDNIIVHSDTASDQTSPYVEQGADGQILIGWSDDRAATDLTVAIVGQLFSVDGGGGGGGQTITGTNGNDTLNGGADKDTLIGKGGADMLFGKGGNDILLGGGGKDILHGNNGNDRLEGGIGNDKLFGEKGKDTMFGGGGNDVLKGGGGKDILHGNNGNDRLESGVGNDKLFGEKGLDKLFGGGGNDVLKGGGGKDILHGNNGNDRLEGGSKGDTLFGEQGKDKLFGNIGRDTLNGGKGADELTGGGGADTFVFKDGYGRDVIKDFADNVDTIQLDDALWTGTLNKQQVINQFATVVGGDIVFDFGTDELTIEGFTNLSALKDDMDII